MINERDYMLDLLDDDEALVLKPRAIYDQAMIGITEDAAGQSAAVYDLAKCIKALQVAHGCDHAEAKKYFQVAYFGERGPVLVNMLERD
jgi:hypothetical protein